MKTQAVENPMRRVKVGQVVINVGVGRAGEPVQRAAKIITELTDQKPLITKARRTVREFGIHRREGIGVKATVRGERAIQLLKRLLQAKGNKILKHNFDGRGNFSFGIREHIEIPGIKYNPELGIVGMNVCVSLVRPGYRISRRRRAPRSVGFSHVVAKDEAISFVKDFFGVEVV